MIHFIQDSGLRIHLELSEEGTIHEYFDAFINFLKASTFADATIYSGLVQAIENIEESLELSHKTFELHTTGELGW